MVKNFIIDGGAGNDTITGTAGNDHISGGAGNDTLNGRDGDDTFYLITAAATPTASTSTTAAPTTTGSSAAGPIDVLRVTNNLTNLAGIEEIDGGDDQIAYNTIIATANHDTLDFSGIIVKDFKIDGAGGNDTITGTSADNVIIGGAGNDKLDGGEGSDTYHVGVGHGEDNFNDTGTGDNDRILATASGVNIGISAIAGIEEINAQGKLSVKVVGTANHQTLDFSNVSFVNIGLVDALGGNDVIHTSNHTAGQAYRGGGGNDTFHLGAVDSTLRVSSADNGWFDSFDGNTAGAVHRVIAETAGTRIGIAKNYDNDVDIIDGNGKANVIVAGSDSSARRLGPVADRSSSASPRSRPDMATTTSTPRT